MRSFSSAVLLGAMLFYRMQASPPNEHEIVPVTDPKYDPKNPYENSETKEGLDNIKTLQNSLQTSGEQLFATGSLFDKHLSNYNSVLAGTSGKLQELMKAVTDAAKHEREALVAQEKIRLKGIVDVTNKINDRATEHPQFENVPDPNLITDSIRLDHEKYPNPRPDERNDDSKLDQFTSDNIDLARSAVPEKGWHYEKKQDVTGPDGDVRGWYWNPDVDADVPGDQGVTVWENLGGGFPTAAQRGTDAFGERYPNKEETPPEAPDKQAARNTEAAQ